MGKRDREARRGAGGDKQPERKTQKLGRGSVKKPQDRDQHQLEMRTEILHRQVDEGGKISLVLFYQYVAPLWSEARKQEAIDFVTRRGAQLNLGGRVRVAREGFNATVSGTAEGVRAFAEALRGFDDHFKETDFKYIDGLLPDKAFKDLKIVPVAELVFYGVQSEKALALGEGGEHLSPAEYHEKMKEKDTVIIDVRNSYEAAIGRFQKQESEGGARWVDPKMRKSTDFMPWLSKEETKKELEGKQVLMYCTGGVRCERASILVKHQLGDAVKGVYQLQGGIEKYLQEFPDGGFWAGKNKVFDKREAFGVGDPNGTGGVIKTEGKKKGKKNKVAVHDPEVLGECCVCSGQWERYVGKKKCFACGVPVLMCEQCLLLKPDKGMREQQLSVRCPLCKEDGRTEPATEAELIENGVLAKGVGASGQGTGTVLKWGGGHGKKKRDGHARPGQAGGHDTHGSARVSAGAKKFDKPCKFGANCKRADCWFEH